MRDINLTRPCINLLSLIVENKEFVEDLKRLGLNNKKIGKILQNYHGLSLADCGFKTKLKSLPENEDTKEVKKVYFANHSLGPEILTIINGGPFVKDNLYEPDSPEEKLSQQKERIYYNDQIINKEKMEEVEKGWTRIGVKACTIDEFNLKIGNALRDMAPILKNEFISNRVRKVVKGEKERLLDAREQINEKGEDRLLHLKEKGAKPKAGSITQMTGFQVIQLYNYIKQLFPARVFAEIKDLKIFKLIAEIFNIADNIKIKSLKYTPQRIKTLYDNNYKYEKDLKIDQ